MKKLHISLNNTPIKTMLMVLMISNLGGCHAVLLGSAAVASYEVAKDERSASEVASDTRIVADIKQ
ncbi:MAG: hypothetical protein ACPG3T_02080, partial [Pseudomonadales bacterium]